MPTKLLLDLKLHWALQVVKEGDAVMKKLIEGLAD